MQITIDRIIVGGVTHEHVFETDPTLAPQVVHPLLGASPVDRIHVIDGIHKGTIPIAGTGWDEISKHPNYPGKTRLEVFLAEVVKHNDTAARAILGV